MHISLKKTFSKTFKITVITILCLLLLLFALPYLVPKTVSNKIKQFAKGSINGQLDFSETRLSFFKHFPNLTLTLYNLSLKGSAQLQNERNENAGRSTGPCIVADYWKTKHLCGIKTKCPHYPL